MRKPITFANVGLLVLACWMGMGIRATWRQNHARYARIPVQKTRPVQAGIAGGAPALITEAAAYADLINHDLFSADRNNEQPVIQAEKKPKPPVPYVVGTLNIGTGGMVALMADAKDAGAGKFHKVKVGDEIAGYKLDEISDHEVVIEFDGEKTTIDVYESAASVPGAGAYTPPAASSAGPDSRVSNPVGSAGGGNTTPGQPVSTNTDEANAAANANLDQSGKPSVTIEGGFKVTRRVTPFGVMTSKEPITPAKPQ